MEAKSSKACPAPHPTLGRNPTIAAHEDNAPRKDPAVDAAKQVLAIIPARGGSKGIHKKNIRLLAGKPLIAHSIEAALATPSISRVIVSTDDEEIASVAEDWGAEVPFLRPKDISGDRALTSAVSKHALQRLAQQGYKPDYTVLLYPTSPLRSANLLQELVAIGLARNCHVITVKKVILPGLGFFSMDKDNRLNPAGMRIEARGTHADDDAFIVRPQRGNGVNSSFRAYGYFTGRNLRHAPGLKTYVHVLSDPFAFVDIDHEEDLRFAEQALAKGWFSFDWN